MHRKMYASRDIVNTILLLTNELKKHSSFSLVSRDFSHCCCNVNNLSTRETDVETYQVSDRLIALFAKVAISYYMLVLHLKLLYLHITYICLHTFIVNKQHIFMVQSCMLVTSKGRSYK